MASASSIQVVVRLRPMNEKEKAEGTLPIISASGSQKTVTVIKGVGPKQVRSSFQFDNVFTSFSNQSEVFSATLQPVIGDVLKGYETCVFAYGQTGTGKTHTMEGKLNDPDQYGVIPRSAQALFESLNSANTVESKISCSYLEIYNEELRDLLDVSEKKKIDVMNTGKGVKCRGLSEQIVRSAEDVLLLMQKAAQSRRVGETRMNRESSRSHCIFTLSVNASKKLPNGGILESHGKLHMVDLAGSESAKTAELKDSSAKDQAAREQERRNINKSLLTLGRVITSLKEQSNGGKKKHAQIPYRDSKLTRILQEALGGRCKTVVIATISPSVLNLQESLQTLHYAQTANGIKNKVSTASSYLTVAGGNNVLNSFHENGNSSNCSNAYAVEKWQEMEIRMEHMQHEVEEARQALARNYMQHQELTEKAEAAEKEQQKLQEKLQTSQLELDLTKEKLEEMACAKNSMQKELNHTKTVLVETATILRATQETEAALTSEAKALMHALEESISNRSALHILMKKKQEEKENVRVSTRNFHDALLSILKNVTEKLEKLNTTQTNYLRCMKETTADDNMQRQDAINMAQGVVSDIAKEVSALSKTIQENLMSNIFASLESLEVNIHSKANEAKNVVKNGERGLSDTCIEARKQLDIFANVLDKHQARNNKAVEESQLQIEKALDNVKNQIQNLALRAQNTIGMTRKHTTQTIQALRTATAEWKDLGLTTTNQLKDISAVQKTSLGKTKNLLNAEMKRHLSVKEKLLSQNDFLILKRQSQMKALNEQLGMLAEHRAQIEENKQRQDMLCKQVMETVLENVKNLVSKQLKLVVSDNESRAQQLLGVEKNLKVINEKVQTEAEELFLNFENTNKALMIENDFMKNTDTQVLESLKDGHQGFVRVNKLANDFLDKQGTISQAAIEATDTIESLNLGTEEICGTLNLDEKRCVEFIDNTVCGVARECVQELSNISSDALTYSKCEIIEKERNLVKKIEDPMNFTMKEVSELICSMDETAKRKIDDINTSSEKLLKTAEGIGRKVEISKKDFNSTVCQLHRSQIQQSYDRLQRIMKTNDTTVKTLIQSCEENMIDMNKKTTKFCHHDIQMDIEVPAISPLKDISYCKSLSSTAAKETILEKCFDLGSKSVEHITTDPINKVGNEEKSPRGREKSMNLVLRERNQNHNKRESNLTKFSAKRVCNGDANRAMKRKKQLQ